MRRNAASGASLDRRLVLAPTLAITVLGGLIGRPAAARSGELPIPRMISAIARQGFERDHGVPRLLPPNALDALNVGEWEPVLSPANVSRGPTLRPPTAPRSWPAAPPSIPEAPLRDEVDRAQYSPDPGDGSVEVDGPAPSPLSPSTFVADPPLSYEGPDPSLVEDIEVRDGPHIPEPMVFDLVRGLGARRGELEVNVLSLAPFGRRGSKYEWAPEIEYAIRDGLAVEFELPIFGTHIEATKYAIQYTFGTAFNDAFIHGAQGILYYDLTTGKWSPTALYVAGLRLDRTWSILAMIGGTVGPQIFPFSEEPAQTGTDIITNLSIFADIRENLVVGLETNLSRQLRGPSELLVTPQIHWGISEHFRVQFGVGYRDDVEGRNAELGFRVIWER